MIKSLYESDFVKWSDTMAALMRDRHFDQVDWENVIEEIESLGRNDKRALKSQMVRVMMHMLKWDYQQELRSRSWILSIVQGQGEISDLIRDSPSLASYLESSLVLCYRQAVKEASAETGLTPKTFPEDCPYTLVEILSREFEL